MRGFSPLNLSPSATLWYKSTMHEHIALTKTQQQSLGYYGYFDVQKLMQIRYWLSRDAYAGGGAGGARIALHTDLFPSLLLSEGAFSGIVDSSVQDHFSGGKPPDNQICIVFLGNKYTKHCSSGKEIEDQNLPLWRNMHIHRCALRGSLAPLP